jgi:glycosyltransferase involved in cell wall biosynthesis
MKVVLFDPHISGHHPYWVYFLARYLTEQGDTVSIVTSSSNNGAGEPLRRLGESVEFHYVAHLDDYGQTLSSSARLVNELRAFNACLDIAREIGPDIVHHLSLDRCIIPIYKNIRGRSRSFALFGMLLWPYMVSEHGENKAISRKLVHALERRLLSRMLTQGSIEKIFVTTGAIKDSLVQSLGTQTANRIMAIPDPVELVDPIPQSVARQALGLPLGVPIFSFLGNLSVVKGVDTFLQALPLVPGDWMAIMAGLPIDTDRTQVEACRKSLRFGSQLVTRFGYIPESELVRYLAASDVVVLPYKQSFIGSSGILLRATAMGRPVLASDVHQLGHIVRESGLGMVYPPESPAALAHALETVIRRRGELAREVEPRALKYAQSHDSRIMAQRIREVYAKVIGTH